jgi:hypothetical protein
MSDKVRQFCNSVHDKLATLEGRMESLKLNIGPTCYSLHEKLDELRHKTEASKQAVTQARTNLERWSDDRKAESQDTIDQWIENRQTRKLDSRAQKAEEYAWVAIELAEVSIDDAERMVLEAIAARFAAEAVTVG